MFDAVRTLADALTLAYILWLESLVDEEAEREFASRWPDVSLHLAAAIRRVGGPVVWLDRHATGPADDTPFVIASVDEPSGRIRFDVATARQIRGLPAANKYDTSGGRLS